MKPIKIVLLCLLVSLAGLNTTFAQDSKKDEIKALLDSKQYVFKAQFALPMRGGSRNLTSEYDLIVNKDSIASYLPYFGRAYSAPIYPTEGGIKFETKKFDYKMENRKKGGWIVTINPEKNKSDVNEMMLTVSESGYATLQVTSVNRDPISFNGIITQLDKKEEKDKGK